MIIWQRLVRGFGNPRSAQVWTAATPPVADDGGACMSVRSVEYEE